MKPSPSSVTPRSPVIRSRRGLVGLVATLVMMSVVAVAASEGDGTGMSGNVGTLSGVEVETPVLIASVAPETSTPRRQSPSAIPSAELIDWIELDQNDALPEGLLRILMSRSPHDPRWYPSSFQVGSRSAVVSGKARREAVVYLRVVDVGPSVADEREPPHNNGGVELCESRGGPLAPVREGVYRTTADIVGRFGVIARFILSEGRPPAAGDGFFVEASADADFQCAPSCPRTGTFRLWKRIYLERDAMYRSGATVVSLVPAGSTRLAVDDVRPFRSARRDRPVGVLLMHAPLSGGDGETRREEPNLVVATERPDRKDRGGFVELAYPTLAGYDPGDAIAVPGKGVFEVPSMEAAASVFAKAFVELVEVENPNPTLPHRLFRAETLGEDFRSFAQRWSDYGESSPASAHNVVLVVSADHKTQTTLDGREMMHPAIGSCSVRPARVNSIFLWQGAIAEQVRLNEKGVGIGGRRADAVLDEVVIHEMAHLFGVADCEDCEKWQNRDGTGLSTMSVPVGPEMGDGVAGFHPSEYLRIRRSVDPLPQS